MAEIDLTRLPAPKVIEELDFETIFERKKQHCLSLSHHPSEKPLQQPCRWNQSR